MASCCPPPHPSSSSGSEGENRPQFFTLKPLDLLHADGTHPFFPYTENPLKSYQAIRSNWTQAQHRALSEEALGVATDALARDETTGNRVDEKAFSFVSNLMCWNLPRYCAVKAGIISQSEYDSMHAQTGSLDVISLNDKKVNSAEALKEVPRGDVIGFFDPKAPEERQLVHAMISMGEGRAIGCKNNCLPVTVGNTNAFLEEVDLHTQLLQQGRWTENGEVTQLADNGSVYKKLIITHRPLSEIGKIPTSEQPSNEASPLAQASGQASTSAQA
ncbi:hypothetical protein B0O95_104264 [Mycetohabitans endofungorum]|uniref:Uncharacterized protein n=1 Tax=Mycetohabitans endofungorum TaxID=417203 RepID=A0A2P5KC96_9BURK|nr:hypothetical protein B0O95_104264 [Mycetohabitans endofungorum]